MSKIIIIGALLGALALTYRVSLTISPGALNLALGVILGAMFGLPAALIALATGRNQRVDVYHHALIAQTPQQPVAGLVAVSAPKYTQIGANVAGRAVILVSGAERKQLGVRG